MGMEALCLSLHHQIYALSLRRKGLYLLAVGECTRVVHRHVVICTE